MFSDKEVIDYYKGFLEEKYPTHVQGYCRRVENQFESAKAEAVTFSFLRNFFDDVRVIENISTGGPDFLCESNGSKIIVEATCLTAESVVVQSSWKNEMVSGVFSFSMITHMLRTKASSKVPQLSVHDFPRILVITCEHIGADVLLGVRGAKALLTSDLKIRVPIDQPIENLDFITDLQNSVFFRYEKGELKSCRNSISAILLLSIFEGKILVVGVLHPDPKYELPIRLLPSIPFLRIAKWPPTNKEFETEWVIHSPNAAEFYYGIME